MIYLDYAANTPVDPGVLQTFVSCEQKYIANPNSAHPLGASARQKMAEVTGRIASTLKIDAAGIIYTSGASEANNTAIKGIARAKRNAGKHIISTSLEHPSVSGTLTYLQEQGWEIDLVDIGRDGKIDTRHMRELVRKDTILIAVTAVDSELGTIQPINQIIEIKKQNPNCLLHVDATQASGNAGICKRFSQ
ncbi:MAG: aminotransferase class V-fold PLP-dependent enzyme [Clostridia bacterium]|nr:aminotransferase class V-fold PLP-dependent enzyme [Clostridia bacterium]